MSKLLIALFFLVCSTVIVSSQDTDILVDFDPEDDLIAIWEEEFTGGEEEGLNEESNEWEWSEEELVEEDDDFVEPNPDDVACYMDPGCMRNVRYCDRSGCCFTKICDYFGFCDYNESCA